MTSLSIGREVYPWAVKDPSERGPARLGSVSDAPAGEPPESEPPAGEPPSIPAQRIRYFQRPRVRRRTGMLAAVAVGIVGAQLGMLLFGSTTERVGPLEVQLDARLGAGDLVISLPPLG